jgi:hypothetical protein
VIFEVFVCPTCYSIAEKLYRDCEQGIKQSLVLLKDAIRHQLATRSLHLPEAPEVPSHTEVMRRIVWLQEAYDVARNGPRAGDTAILPRKPTG